MRWGMWFVLLCCACAQGMAEWLEGDFLLGTWGGKRETLARHGMDLSLSFLGDATWDVHGGRQPGRGGFEDLWELSFICHSEPLWHYEGGTFVLDVQSHQRVDSINRVVGSGPLLFVSSIEAPPFTEVYDLYYRQRFRWGKGRDVWMQLGKTDAVDDEHFAYTRYANLFVNTVWEVPPAIPFLPTYPSPAFAAIVSVRPIENLAVRAAVFDGSLAEGINTGTHGIGFDRFFYRLSHHAFLIAEMDLSWAGGGGELRLGAWRHTSKIARFAGGFSRKVAGSYAIFDQALWRGKASCKVHGVSLFAAYGHAPKEESTATNSYGVGLLCEGCLIAPRFQDDIGVGFTAIELSDVPQAGFVHHYESVIEVFYLLNLTPWVFVQPDYQYIVHPGGASLPNATALTLRVGITF